MAKTSKQLLNKAESYKRQAKALEEKAQRQEDIEAVLKVFGAYKVNDSTINKAIDIFNKEIEANQNKPNNPFKNKKKK